MWITPTTLLLNFLNWVIEKMSKYLITNQEAKLSQVRFFTYIFLPYPASGLGWAFQCSNIVGVGIHRKMYPGRWSAWLLCVLFIPSVPFEPQELKSCLLLTGAYGPEHWVTSSVSCGGRQQSPIDISDQHARVSEEYQDLQLDGFDNESSNKTWMKNTGKTGKLHLLYLSVGQHEMFMVSLVCTLTMTCSFSCTRYYRQHKAEWELWNWPSV